MFGLFIIASCRKLHSLCSQSGQGGGITIGGHTYVLYKDSRSMEV